MSAGPWSYLLFTAGLAATLAGIVVHYSRAKRRDRLESPKYRMLEDDAAGPDRRPTSGGDDDA